MKLEIEKKSCCYSKQKTNNCGETCSDTKSRILFIKSLLGHSTKNPKIANIVRIMFSKFHLEIKVRFQQPKVPQTPTGHKGYESVKISHPHRARGYQTDLGNFAILTNIRASGQKCNFLFGGREFPYHGSMGQSVARV